MMLKSGDRVEITYEGRTVDALVFMASPNGLSLFVRFEAMLGGFVGAMPVLGETSEGPWRDVFYGLPVALKRHA